MSEEVDCMNSAPSCGVLKKSIYVPSDFFISFEKLKSSNGFLSNIQPLCTCNVNRGVCACILEPFQGRFCVITLVSVIASSSSLFNVKHDAAAQAHKRGSMHCKVSRDSNFFT